MRFVLIVLVMLGLLGCDLEHSLNLSKLKSITVVHSGQSQTYAKDTVEFERTIKWIESNQSGWESYYATPAQGDLFIKGEGFTLNIGNGSVVLNYKSGDEFKQLIKQIDSSDFKYLRY